MTLPTTRNLLCGLALCFACLAGPEGFGENKDALTDAVRVLLEEYQPLASRPFSAQTGEKTWHQNVEGRSCTSCHTNSLDSTGRHEKTGKLIEPMARSVNPDRLTDAKKMRKWFLRNCKWTYGRECTAQEKGDILFWLIGQ